jgi:hypothetical protein
MPDDVAERLAVAGGDLSRRALEALALEGYREQALTLYQVLEMLGLTRVATITFPSPQSQKQIWTAKRHCSKRRHAVSHASERVA